jgi:hypothetical protein
MAAAFALTGSVACEDDPERTIIDGEENYHALTQRADVLHNLELAYNRRNVAKYEELLDPSFTFFVAPGDVSQGLPEQWGWADEATIHARLFDNNYSGTALRCEKIMLDVLFEDGVTWVEVEPLSSPGEKWYVATVLYVFRFDMEWDYHLISSPGAKAQFSVRNAGTDEAPRWQLVEMRDLSNESFGAYSSRSTETATWGKVKALYR